MKTIIITGPSASGKSKLTNKLFKLFDGTIVIKTDSYYRDSFLIKLLSLFKFDIYDRPLSIKRKELNKTLKSIHNKERVIIINSYDFRRRKSLKSNIQLNYKGTNQFLIIEGIFSHRLDINYKETINIVCKEEKEICLKRRLKRDKRERGRNSLEVKKRFNKSWDLFYEKINTYLNNNQIIELNPSDKLSYDNLVLNLLNIKKNN